MSNPRWNYFLALEDDLDRVSRYVDFDAANFATYSIEMARVLMSATQEIDVLMKQICNLKGYPGHKEAHYRRAIPSAYPNIVSAEVEVARFGLSFRPFADWSKSTTPKWWTANNKVKHERNERFGEASLENMLNAVCALLLANLYYHDAEGSISELFPGTRHLSPSNMVKSVTPSRFGMIPNYEVL